MLGAIARDTVEAEHQEAWYNLCPWLTDQSFPLIPQPLLPQGEKGSWT
jgi:hypothetical protein